MKVQKKQLSAGGMIVALIVLVNVIILVNGLTRGNGWYWWLVVTLPALIIALRDIKNPPMGKDVMKKDPNYLNENSLRKVIL